MSSNCDISRRACKAFFLSLRPFGAAFSLSFPFTFVFAFASTSPSFCCSAALRLAFGCLRSGRRPATSASTPPRELRLRPQHPPRKECDYMTPEIWSYTILTCALRSRTINSIGKPKLGLSAVRRCSCRRGQHCSMSVALDPLSNVTDSCRQ